MEYARAYTIFLMTLIFLAACQRSEEIPTTDQPGEEQEVVYLPVVVHVIHHGQTPGEGPNLSEQRIIRQIEILNEDFRKKQGTRGHSNHPAAADTRIEFVLAERKPDGTPTNGINRVNATEREVDHQGYDQNHFAQYAYWNPRQYINIWTTPLPETAMCIVLGSSSGPQTDLPGTSLLSLPASGDAEGILINWMHFGESDIACQARYGRTLTHEMGHYLGLLHTWGGKDCASNDYCADTPAVDKEVTGRQSFPGCQGESVMIGNYMNYTDDEVMNLFTHDQARRMHYVLANHPGRHALITSPGLDR
jgi:hypothetical protein